jgi:hypothetical protein
MRSSSHTGFVEIALCKTACWEDTADDGADLAAGVGRVGRLLGGHTVRVLDRPPCALQAAEEGVFAVRLKFVGVTRRVQRCKRKLFDVLCVAVTAALL